MKSRFIPIFAVLFLSAAASHAQVPGDPEDVAAATLKADLASVKADVGLGNVNNTSDANKPVSIEQQIGLNLKQVIFNVRDENVVVETNPTRLNFVGAGVTATGAGGIATITIPGGGGTGGGGEELLQSGETIPQAVTRIGTSKKTLVILEDANLASAVTIPATLLLELKNGAKITKSATGGITFQGIGLKNPMSQLQAFSGFVAGDITFTGTDYPREISAELWGTSAVAVQEKYNRADAALLGKRAKIHVLTGKITGRSTVTQYHHLHFGAGDFANSSTTPAQIVLHNDTRLSGEGVGRTTIRESSDTTSSSTVQLVYGATAIVYPFNLPLKNIQVDNLRFFSETDRQFETAASAVFLGNVVGGSINNCEFDSTHGFGAYVGAFADPENRGPKYYAENFSIHHNVFKNLGAQNAGVIQGKNVHIHHNQFLNIGRTVMLVNDGVANGTTKLTSATAVFQAHHAGGAPIVISKAGQTPFTTSIASVTNANTVVLNTVIPYSASGVTVKIHSPFLSVIDLEPNDYNDILENITITDNIIDGRNSAYLANGIVAQLGGAGSARNLRISNNDIIGADVPLNDTIGPIRGLSQGIQLYGGDGATISGNNIRGTGQSGISVGNTVRSMITDNQLLMTGGGGNPAIQVIGSNNNTFAGNSLKIVGVGSQSSNIIETEFSGTVNVSASDGTSSIVTFVNGSGQYFYAHNVRSDIIIGGVTYTITDFANIGSITIYRPSGGALTNQAYTSRYNSNLYQNNSGTTYLSANSYSTIQTMPTAIASNFTPVGNSAGATTSLHNYVIAGNSLLAPNDTLTIKHAGRFAANANANKRITVAVAGITSFDTGNLALNNKAWLLEMQWVYVTSNSQWIVFRFLADGLPVKTEMVNLTLDHSSSYNIALTGAGAGANDVSLKMTQITKQQ
jgi:hypothetical protein